MFLYQIYERMLLSSLDQFPDGKNVCQQSIEILGLYQPLELGSVYLCSVCSSRCVCTHKLLRSTETRDNLAILEAVSSPEA